MEPNNVPSFKLSESDSTSESLTVAPRVTWNDQFIFVPEITNRAALKQLKWSDVYEVTISKHQPAQSAMQRTLNIMDDDGHLYKIELAEIGTKARWMELVGTIQFALNHKVVNLTLDPNLFDSLHETVIPFWPYNDEKIDHKSIKTKINFAIVLFTVLWIAEFLFLTPGAKVPGSNVYFLMQIFKCIPFLLIPLYGRTSPITQIRCTPLALTCETCLAGTTTVRSRIDWFDVREIYLSEPKPNQRILDRYVCFKKKSGRVFKIKLEKIANADNWNKLLSAISYCSGRSIQNLDRKLLDNLNPDQKDPTYTQIWLDSLSAPPQREKLQPLSAGVALQGGKYILEKNWEPEGKAQPSWPRPRTVRRLSSKNTFCPFMSTQK